MPCWVERGVGEQKGWYLGNHDFPLFICGGSVSAILSLGAHNEQ